VLWRDQVVAEAALWSAIAIHVLEPPCFMKLLDQILVAKLEVSRQLDLVD